MSKILKGEAKAQAASLQSAVKELSRLQKVQKNAAAVSGTLLITFTRLLEFTATERMKAKL